MATLYGLPRERPTGTVLSARNGHAILAVTSRKALEACPLSEQQRERLSAHFFGLVQSGERCQEFRQFLEEDTDERREGHRRIERYRITVGDGRSTEALVAAGDYGYAHSCVTSDNFPVRRPDAVSMREVVLLEFARGVTSEEAVAEAARLGLERPIYEDALAFGAAYPAVQVERPVVFLHDPWFGCFGRRDVISLWCNAGRRELGLEGFDGPWHADWRFGFVSDLARSAVSE